MPNSGLTDVKALAVQSDVAPVARDDRIFLVRATGRTWLSTGLTAQLERA